MVTKYNQQLGSMSSPVFYMLCWLCVLVMSGCSTLPPRPDVPLQSFRDHVSRDSTLAQLIDPLKELNPELTGYHLLDDPLEALAARLRLIDKAEKTLDLQYYIWENDNIGALALHGLINAADRGVKVRLLIDDHNAKSLEGIYLALDQHENIDVRLYNPFGFRQFRAMDFLLDLKRVNRRMHNKSFIADHQIALIGGRNMSNQYFHSSDQYQFSDVDIILVGAATEEISDSFDEYWNDEYAYPVRGLVNAQKHQLRYPSLKAQLNAHYQKVSVQNYLDLTHRSQDFDHWLHHDIRFSWVKATVLKDPPGKIRNESPKEEYLNSQLLGHLEPPKTHLDIVSAYFIPEKKGAETLSRLSKDGVQVRVLTNSYRATDVPVVHAFYMPYREALLQNNVHLYEFLATPESTYLNPSNRELASKAKINFKALSRSSLHTKLMAIDHQQVFVGSFNFDPRSAYLNTEIGVLLDSPQLASAIHLTMDQDLRKYTYELMLDDRQKVRWKFQRHNGETEIYPHEPDMKWWQKLGLTVFSWLPIEGYM